MKKIIFLSILITIIAAFFASAHPDGLDYTSEKLNLVGKNLNFFAPFTDYSLKILPEGGFSTAIAGLAGLLIIFALFFVVIKIGKKLSAVVPVILLIACLITLNSNFIYAVRPLVTDDFYILSPEEKALEIAAQETGIKNADNTMGLVMYYHQGIIPGLEFGVELPYSFSYPSFGFQDVLLHAKAKFSEFADKNGITFRLDSNLANGDPNTGSGNGFTDYTLMAIYSDEMGDILLHLNLGYLFFGVNPGDSLNNAIFYSSAFEYRIPDWATKFVGEYYAWSYNSNYEGYLSLGSYTDISENMIFDLSYAVGLNEFSNNTLTVGLTFNF